MFKRCFIGFENVLFYLKKYIFQKLILCVYCTLYLPIHITFYIRILIIIKHI